MENMMCIENPFADPRRGASELEPDLTCAARSDIRVLITGEDMMDARGIARAIHRKSSRHRARFMPIDCASTSEAQLEAKLFGRAPGADGTRGTRGCLERAHGGTVLVGDVGALTLRLQARLQQFLDTGEIRRMGADCVHRKVDVRVITWGFRGLFEQVQHNTFRQELFYRLNALHLVIPSAPASEGDRPN